MLKLRFALLAASLIAVASAAYGFQKQSDEPPKPLPPLAKTFPLDQTFSLREINGKPVPASLDVSFKVDGALHASGFAGCNSWSGTIWPAKEQHLLVGQFALTHKQCDKDTMAIESSFLAGLLGSPAWDLVNGDLVIRGPRGALRLTRSL